MAVLYNANLPQVAYSAQQVQKNESIIAKKMGVDMYQLMQRAGKSVFSVLWDRFNNVNDILILAGKGNNGGDGYIVAKSAIENNLSVKVFSICEPNALKGDALRAYTDFVKAGGVLETNLSFDACDLIIDALLGTGFSGELSEEIQNITQHANSSYKPIISIDVPSGVNATTGYISEHAICANTTVTFIGLKQALLSGIATNYVGKLFFSGLGISDEFEKRVDSNTHYLSQASLLSHKLIRKKASYKNQHGHVLVIGGDKGMAGAVRLAGEACLRSGAGLVSIATHIDNVSSVLNGRYELMVHGIQDDTHLIPLIEKSAVIVIGPGMGQSSWSKMLWQTLLIYSEKVKIIDADGLNFLANNSVNLKNCVLTPHVGEASRLLQCTNQDIEFNRFDAVRKISERYQSTVVLKGPGSLVCNDEKININCSGTAAMASAGMGDVLSGIIGGLVAQKMPELTIDNSIKLQNIIFEMTCLGVFIHGQAAQDASVNGINGLLASDLFPHIRRLVG
ncbi:NAD(P)H-hydrate dehydratase [Pseudoalteromonas denitrificans]|uniref:Bifunctional NAD(P)H-hydrate repair enzyme n=1 Tax=Pseudoalteromonas denitrificans DSM 6059 TaxID=1123010 RepID=A0A1I1K6V4_9GAMM|nr:NAD(P)H-hydrate dehydratase [Pseudoalteromonas denitrificans]SFC53763.1 NAD(P)H-hydrate epimerase [Pseudoalteromonas denitrificans DSM 6059]